MHLYKAYPTHFHDLRTYSLYIHNIYQLMHFLFYIVQCLLVALTQPLFVLRWRTYHGCLLRYVIGSDTSFG